MKKTFLLEIIITLIVVLFLYASLSKLTDMESFAGDMHRQPFPPAAKPYLIWIVPLSEVLISLCLLYETIAPWLQKVLSLPESMAVPEMLLRFRRIGLWASLILMFLLTGYTAAAVLHFFEKVPCSCGGVIRKLSWPQHLILNIFYTTISAIGLALSRITPYKNSSPETKSLETALS